MSEPFDLDDACEGCAVLIEDVAQALGNRNLRAAVDAAEALLQAIQEASDEEDAADEADDEDEETEDEDEEE